MFYHFDIGGFRFCFIILILEALYFVYHFDVGGLRFCFIILILGGLYLVFSVRLVVTMYSLIVWLFTDTTIHIMLVRNKAIYFKVLYLV